MKPPGYAQRLAWGLALLFLVTGCGKKSEPGAEPPQEAPPAATAPEGEGAYQLKSLPDLSTLDAGALGWPGNAGVDARLEWLNGLEAAGPSLSVVRATLQLALADADPQVRARAVELTALLPAAEAAPLLNRLLTLEPVADVRYQALDTVSGWSGPEALPLLATALHGPFPDAQKIAASQLAMRSSKASLETLMTGLQSQDADLRERVNDGLNFLIGHRFQSHEEAQAWWQAHAADYDAKLFRREGSAGSP